MINHSRAARLLGGMGCEGRGDCHGEARRLCQMCVAGWAKGAMWGAVGWFRRKVDSYCILASTLLRHPNFSVSLFVASIHVKAPSSLCMTLFCLSSLASTASRTCGLMVPWRCICSSSLESNSMYRSKRAPTSSPLFDIGLFWLASLLVLLALLPAGAPPYAPYCALLLPAGILACPHG